MQSNSIIFIVGPTAVGKSEIAYSLARRINGEIVSCDSMQVYKELRVVTSKPSAWMLKTVAHHLIDCVSVGEEFDVALFNALVLEAIRAIQARDHVPIVVGGSGLYMQVLLDGIFPAAPKNEAVRVELKKQAGRYGSEYLYKELQKVDSQAALKIHPNDARRIIRALEVYKTRWEPISSLHKKHRGLWGKYDIKAVALTMDREGLYRRINRRVDDMFAHGAVKEIEHLRGVALSPMAERLIGLREIRGFLDGSYDETHARELMKLNTRRFAKRQLTWFRKEKRLEWITVQENDTVKDITDKLMFLWEREEDSARRK